MKTSFEVSEEKLRGGFYSPAALVHVCLDRTQSLLKGRRSLRLLEPSVGDGAFLRGLSEHELRYQIEEICAVELLPAEATKARSAMRAGNLRGQVRVGNAIEWAARSRQTFDVAVGNPPFLRYQFVSAGDKAAIEVLSKRLDISFGGVSNLWIPLLLSAFARLDEGGVFSFIIPAECFTGVSARTVRTWLIRNTTDLSVDLFPPGSFPGVLQEVVILSGTKVQSSAVPSVLRVRQHQEKGAPREWVHDISVDAQTWTRWLLTPAQLSTMKEAVDLAVVGNLASAAKFDVSIVTGANDYFSVDERTVEAFDLSRWVKPLLPRVRHARGLRYLTSDHRHTISEAKGFLLHFEEGLPCPEGFAGPRSYLNQGVEMGIPSRYKCRIRQPWYRVPYVWAGELMMSKRSHYFPRVLSNQARVLTTDTIYRGWMKERSTVKKNDLVGAFHNSLTLLSAEIEGRSFGGGVLELVPTEIGRLTVPLVPGFGSQVSKLDDVMRKSTSPQEAERLVEETDALLLKANVGFSPAMLEVLKEARASLLQRRLDRT